MAHISEEIINEDRRSNWVRLRTLVWLRWIAIAGQIVTICVAMLFLGFQLSLGGFAVVIGASIIVNVVAAFVYPETCASPNAARHRCCCSTSRNCQRCSICLAD
jgi:two-component system sensor histidine kinase RegB